MVVILYWFEEETKFSFSSYISLSSWHYWGLQQY